MVTNPGQATDDELKELFVETWPKSCMCGATFTEDGWEGLRYVGVQKAGITGCPDLELRNCGQCGSTLAIAVTGDFEVG